ncbi:MAG: alpha-L-arabinofuranosidase C-terminal domain-containing protein [Terriglobales bacterium]
MNSTARDGRTIARPRARSGTRRKAPRHAISRDQEPMRVSLAVAGGNISSAQGRMLHDNDLNAGNTFDRPDRIVPRPLPVRSGAGGWKWI